jgi:hypothetical protein
MSFRAPYALLLGVMSAAFGTVSCYQSVAHGRQSQPDVDLVGAAKHYNEELRRWDQLSRFDGALMARTEQRSTIVAKVRDGDMSLFEAAAQFKRLNHLPNPSSHVGLALFRGACENERLCRQVIHWLDGNALSGWPHSRRRAVLDRVEAELHQHLERHGTVVLPGD